MDADGVSRRQIAKRLGGDPRTVKRLASRASRTAARSACLVESGWPPRSERPAIDRRK